MLIPINGISGGNKLSPLAHKDKCKPALRGFRSKFTTKTLLSNKSNLEKTHPYQMVRQALNNTRKVKGQLVVILTLEKAQEIENIFCKTFVKNQELEKRNKITSTANSSQEIDDVESRPARTVVLSKEEVQSRRDQVRIMAAQGKPLENIPAYDGKGKHGEAIEFFRKKYTAFIEPGYETIFATDLANIDDRLLRAIRNECRGGTPSPIGTASDLSKALVDGRFLDGKNTSARVAGARWRQKNQSKEVDSPEFA